MENTMHMLQFLIEVFCAVLFVGIAAVLGTLAAAKCLPFDPAEWVTKNTNFEQYCNTQYLLRIQRLRREVRAAEKFDELVEAIREFVPSPSQEQESPAVATAVATEEAFRAISSREETVKARVRPQILEETFVPRKRTKTLAMGSWGGSVREDDTIQTLILEEGW